jgi:hypothetical protein
MLTLIAVVLWFTCGVLGALIFVRYLLRNKIIELMTVGFYAILILFGIFTGPFFLLYDFLLRKKGSVSFMRTHPELILK